MKLKCQCCGYIQYFDDGETAFKAGWDCPPVYGPAMGITDQNEAHEYFEKLIEYTLPCLRADRRSRDVAERIVKSNLGYYAGYYDNETRERVERLFNCVHPFFGSIETNGPPTPEQAFKMGQDFGAGANRQEIEQPGPRPAPKLRAIEL